MGNKEKFDKSKIEGEPTLLQKQMEAEAEERNSRNLSASSVPHKDTNPGIQNTHRTVDHDGKEKIINEFGNYDE